MNVVWMRQSRSRVAHGFADVDLSVGFERVEPLGACGRFPVADLQEDELADRCGACVRAAVSPQ